jgi:hypothetical protein
MTELKRLREEGRSLVASDDHLMGVEYVDKEKIEPYLEPADGSGNLEVLSGVLNDAMDEYDEGNHEIEAEVAQAVHENINLTRRQAADAGVWHYLSAVWRPDFVHHRWPPEDRSETRRREKMLWNVTDLYGNTMHQIWWAAELTHENGDYSLTEDLLSFQRLSNWVLDTADFGRYKPAAQACVEQLSDEGTTTVNDLLPDLNHTLSTIPVENKSREELSEMIQKMK